jgi:cephalosporin hydroxylase
MIIPPNIEYSLDAPLRDFWKQRLEVHTNDAYKGRVLAKMPEDLRTYQHIIEDSAPEVIVELGSFDGGSAIWFADQLTTLVQRDWRATTASVISLDIAKIRTGIFDRRIQFLQGDVKDPLVWKAITDLVAGRRVMISEDSQHSFASTEAALNGFADLVSPGCWFVVEDGVVDEQEVKLPRYRGGVQPAIEAFLATEKGSRFSRHHLQPYGLTTDFGGWLRADR